jgi:hypothetical protein
MLASSALSVLPCLIAYPFAAAAAAAAAAAVVVTTLAATALAAPAAAPEPSLFMLMLGGYETVARTCAQTPK